MDDIRKISIEEAKKEVELAGRRIGLLHLAYAETLVEEFGEKEGKKLILKSIKNYGTKVGEKVKGDLEREGLEPEPENFGEGDSRNLPRFGISEETEEVVVDGEGRTRVHGCVMAKVWSEHGEEDLGKLYCYVDAAKYMGFNPCYKMIHTKNEPSGDDFCEFAVRKTTEKEREDFSSDTEEWSRVDENLL